MNRRQCDRMAQFSGLVRSDIGDHRPASNLAFNETVKEKMKQGQKVFHFGFGQSPFPLPVSFVNEHKNNADKNEYLPVAGLMELRSAIVDFHRRHDKLEHSLAENVIVGPGSKELIFLLVYVFCGDILISSPSWTTYKSQVELAQHQPIIVETNKDDSWKVTPELLEQVVRKHNLTRNILLILCNPDNPTGTSYTSSELKCLSTVFRKHCMVVLSDEIYGRLNYTHHESVAHYYPEGTIISTGFSKWASAGGWRVGYQIYPTALSALRDSVISAASHTYTCASTPQQYAIAAAMKNSEECDEYIKHTNRIMRALAKFCYSELKATGIDVTEPQGGYYIFPDFELVREALNNRGVTSGEQMCDVILQEARVALLAGGPSFLRSHDELTTRLCFVNFDGKAALTESERIGLSEVLPRDFVQNYCSPVYQGIQALKTWVTAQLKMIEQ